jgi:hypothetical protein
VLISTSAHFIAAKQLWFRLCSFERAPGEYRSRSLQEQVQEFSRVCRLPNLREDSSCRVFVVGKLGTQDGSLALYRSYGNNRRGFSIMDAGHTSLGYFDVGSRNTSFWRHTVSKFGKSPLIISIGVGNGIGGLPCVEFRTHDSRRGTGYGLTKKHSILPV